MHTGVHLYLKKIAEITMRRVTLEHSRDFIVLIMVLGPDVTDKEKKKGKKKVSLRI